ncbi:MAG: YbaB/EbfC family nucleoid-associated protein [Clostridia bacterium]|nr:YbaB/EbfC family nucleoid-associated protein [Clostridia bacterium]
MKARIQPGQQNSRAQMMEKIQKMQSDMEAARADVEAREFTASSGGGAVEVCVTGSHEVKSINVKPEVMDPEEPEMLEDMLIAALNEAIRKANDTMDAELEKISGGMEMPSIPGLM